MITITVTTAMGRVAVAVVVVLVVVVVLLLVVVVVMVMVVVWCSWKIGFRASISSPTKGPKTAQTQPRPRLCLCARGAHSSEF